MHLKDKETDSECKMKGRKGRNIAEMAKITEVNER